MYLYVQPHSSNTPTKIRLLEKEDFDKLLKEFPFLESSFVKYIDLADVVRDMAYQLSSHNIDAWVELS